MPAAEDPYYTRSQVPDAFIEHVAPTGLSEQDEFDSRHRKHSINGVPISQFSSGSKGGWKPQSDPYYGRKPVPDSMIKGIGETGLSKEEEFENRERKYSVGGVDVRKFGNSSSGGFHPSDDPYYGRTSVPKSGIAGVAETGMSRADEFESREAKTHMFESSGDPFKNLTGTGHRASISAAAAPVAADARRRSSAVAPDHAAAAARATQQYNHSGYEGEKLAPIQSRTDDAIRPSNEYPTTTTTTTTTTSTNVDSYGFNSSTGAGHTQFYNEATKDLDGVAPHERA